MHFLDYFEYSTATITKLSPLHGEVYSFKIIQFKVTDMKQVFLTYFEGFHDEML
jgi:hypothetical protein